MVLITFGMAQLSSPLDGKEGDAMRATDKFYIGFRVQILALPPQDFKSQNFQNFDPSSTLTFPESHAKRV